MVTGKAKVQDAALRAAVSDADFDDVPIASWKADELTTYRQPINRMVAQTEADLMDRIGAPGAPPVKAGLEAELIVRGATRSRRPETCRD